jgi:hypothetical protein
MPLVLVGLVALLAASSLALDAGVLWTARTQLQASVDASALAAAANVIDPDGDPDGGPSVTAGAALASAASVAGANRAVANESVSLEAVEVGRWNTETRQFDGSVDATDPDVVNAVDVLARLDGSDNSAVPAFMARVLGRDAFTVSAQATAWLGFAGSALPGSVDLPVAIDCCAIQGPGCDQDYCETIDTAPPYECELSSVMTEGSGVAQDHDGPGVRLSCLESHGDSTQNSCWTSFQPPGSNQWEVPYMRDLIDAGNPAELEQDDAIELNTGVQATLFSNIIDRFEAEGSNQYPGPDDPAADSWVVRLPVVTCQQGGSHCQEGQIEGFLCFEVRQVERNPGKIVRGRFLCRERDPDLFRDCVLSGSNPGGGNFGIRAEIPVLVR